MKKTLFLSLIALVLCSFSNVGGPKWYSWDEGYELAKAENKPMLVFIHATWCDQCKRMDTKTYSNKEVVTLIQKGYVPIKIDVDKAMKGNDMYKKDGKEFTGKELLKLLVPKGPLGIPLNIIVTTNSETKVMISGLKDSEEMKDLLSANMTN